MKTIIEIPIMAVFQFGEKLLLGILRQQFVHNDLLSVEMLD
jgi:hypothetical protein